MKDNLKNIKRIVDSIDINSKKQILLNGIIAGRFKEDDYSKEPSGKMMFDEIQQLIYGKFYIQPCKTETSSAPTVKELQKRIATLTKANKGVDQFDEGWMAENNEEGEFLFARKGNRLTRLKPGGYLDLPHDNKNKDHKAVRIFRPKEYSSITGIFYFAFGRGVEDNESETVRFYFNATFEGNRKWMEHFTVSLNDFAIPFIFKCLVHPYYYGRSDTSVLYCNRQYAGLVFDLIQSQFDRIKKYMRDSLPLFVYPLKTGIGFAEQPLAEDESFGTHWSKIIAAGIMKAYEKNISKEKWIEEVMGHIRNNHGYTKPESYYRNPGSKYPYPFIKSE